MPKNDGVARLADALRQTADLLEQGKIQELSTNIEYGFTKSPDPKTGGHRCVLTGMQTVTIVIHGRTTILSDAGYCGPVRQSIEAPRRDVLEHHAAKE